MSNEHEILGDMIRLPAQLAQRQDSLGAQLRDLRVVATRLGMYDAADYLAEHSPVSVEETPQP